MVGEAATAHAFSRALFDEGLFATGIGYPTVAQGKARIRTIVTSAHAPPILDRAIEIISRVRQRRWKHRVPRYESRTQDTKIPWYLWASIIGVTSAMVGVEWDISWHRSIGRDTFWTPPHMAIYLCGIIAGIASAYLILATTFGKLPRVRESSVKMWGFHGPLGAFITAWGGIAMLVSAPFDDWWHNAYGLDVKILSPPHAVLALGIISIELGALMLVLGYMNRAQGDERRRLNWLYLYVGSMIVIVLQVMTMEYSFRVVQHTGSFYLAMSIAVPLTLIGVAAGSGHRWGATIIAASTRSSCCR